MKLNLALLQVEVYRHIAVRKSWPNPTEEVMKMAALLDSELNDSEQSIYDVVRDRANLFDLAHQATIKIATETLLRRTQANVDQSREVCLDLAHQLQKAKENYEQENAQSTAILKELIGADEWPCTS